MADPITTGILRSRGAWFAIRLETEVPWELQFLDKRVNDAA
jgi:hypothetical protein